MRIESIVLENHGDIAIFWWNAIYQTAPYENLTLGYLFQSGDHTQSG